MKNTLKLASLLLLGWLTLGMGQPPSVESGTVELIVNGNLQPEIQSELNRMITDLQNEGYATLIKTWPNTDQDAKHLWDYLAAEYQTPGRNLVGAILVGNLPWGWNKQSGETTDLVYWNLKSWGDTCLYETIYGGPPQPWQIWVSRIFALQDNFSEQYFGDEPALVSRALQANHDFRSGASRFSWMVDDWALPEFNYLVNLPQMTFFNNPVENISDGPAWVSGGALMQETSHGNIDCYGTWSWTAGLHETVLQRRYFVGDSCGSMR